MQEPLLLFWGYGLCIATLSHCGDNVMLTPEPYAEECDIKVAKVSPPGADEWPAITLNPSRPP